MGMFSVYWISICLKIRKYTQYTLLQRKIDQNDYFLLSYHYSKIREHRDKKKQLLPSVLWRIFNILAHRVEGWVAVPEPEGGGEDGGGHAGAGAALHTLRLQSRNDMWEYFMFFMQFHKTSFLMSPIVRNVRQYNPKGSKWPNWGPLTDRDSWEVCLIWHMGDMTDRRYDK